MSGVLIVIGLLVMFAGAVLLAVTAFKESVLWGLGVLLIPLVSLIFVILHWRDAQKPFFLWLGGWLLVIVGVVIGGQA